MKENIILTEEQKAIINSSDSTILINAYAGTGKTSTLVKYALENQDKKGLYIAFNKEMQLDAAKRFPENVKCRTLHSLAYTSDVVKPYLKTGKVINSKNRIHHLAKVLNNNNILDIKSAENMLEAWFNSTYLEFSKDIYEVFLNYYASETDNNSKTKEKKQIPFSDSKLNYIWKLANRIKEIMFDVNDDRIKITPNAYLKLFHLSKPDFNQYDFIMLDEAQDSNDLTVDILNLSNCKKKIIVGDIHQAIYQFRGAKNALAEFNKKINKLYNLTYSFRFNQEIANHASYVLNKFKNDKTNIVGKGKEGTIVRLKSNESTAILDQLPQYAVIIARKNASLFDIGAQLLSKNKKVYFSGGIERYQYQLFLDICNLYEKKHNEIKNKDILKNFKTFNEFETYVKESEESDFAIMAKFIKDNGLDSKKILQDFKKIDEGVGSQQIKLNEIDHLLVTSHRSKGLEFFKTVLWNDFNEFNKIKSNPKLLKEYRDKTLPLKIELEYEQEVNLYYVAITRAKEKLIIIE